MHHSIFQAINVHVIRNDYERNGFSVREGEMVQVITVMPDGCFWKVATMNPPFKEGLIPSDLLCPELPCQAELTTAPNSTTKIEESTGNDKFKPVKVFPRFTTPPSVKKPVPAPRSGSPTG